MPKKSFDPKFLLGSVSDPVYEEAERVFVAGQILSLHKVRKMQRKVDWERLKGWNHPQVYLERIKTAWSAHEFSDDGIKAVITAVKVHGLDGFWALKGNTEVMRDDRTKALCELSVEILNVLRHWQQLVREGNIKQRQKAARCLRQFGQAFIPQTKGKKERKQVNPTEVKIFYYKELFRLYQIRNALRQLAGSFGHRVKAASKRFEMSVDQIKELWGLDEEDYKPKMRPLTTKEMARILTARHFEIAQQSVSNIIAS